MPAILITGGCGYIGSHTAIEILEENRFDVISIDNLSNSSERTLDRIEAITGKRIHNYNIDLCDLQAARGVFEAHPEIVGVIHFAALKSVGESVEKPLLYFENNFVSLINVLKCCREFEVGNLIFSSSCSIYGNIDSLPVKEETPIKKIESPYANTKLVGEQIIEAFTKANPEVSCISLRYFNPAGAHESGLNGEEPTNRPGNLVPVIAQAASGLIPHLTVFGGDYDTRDGSCVRDFIHVTDVAIAHIKGLNYLLEKKNKVPYNVFNLGSGEGITVFEMLNAFERITGEKVNYSVGERRPGDVVSIYSDCSKAEQELGWEAKRGIDEMMDSAWKWQQGLNAARMSVER